MPNWKSGDEIPSQIVNSSEHSRASTDKGQAVHNLSNDSNPNDQSLNNDKETDLIAIRRVCLKENGDKNVEQLGIQQKRGSSGHNVPETVLDFNLDALKNAKETAYTLLDKECSVDDMVRVWQSISKFITFKMMEGKGVRVAGLGSFTYLVRKTPVNQKTVKVTKSPIFILSEYVAQMYGLKQDKVTTPNVPEVPLNLSVIANDTRIPRSLIEDILTEVLQALARGITSNKCLEFPFPCIGKLQIRNQKVNMRFYDEFTKKLGFNVVEMVRLPEFP